MTVNQLLDKCTGAKQCKACGEVKPFVNYSINRSNKDGMQRLCKTCDTARQRILRVTKKDEKKQWEKQYRLKNKDNFQYRLKMLLFSSRQRAVARGREHNITLDDLLELFPTDGMCPVFGFKLEFNQAGFRETSPSIDRIDSSKGYTRDNIQIISWKANRIKSYATVEDVEMVLAFMKQGG